MDLIAIGGFTCQRAASSRDATNDKRFPLPSKTRTAVAKSLTLLAAFNAATMTEGEGTRS